MKSEKKTRQWLKRLRGDLMLRQAEDSVLRHSVLDLDRLRLRVRIATLQIMLGQETDTSYKALGDA